MTDYNKSVNFAVKDTLQSGDPNKIVSGTEIDTEFNNISSSSTTKMDKVPAATTGNLAQFTATGAIEDSDETPTTIAALAAPAGVVQAFGGSTAPTGWLECDGSAVSRSTYANLFSAIGTNFGVGDGATTFNLPDLRGEFIRGWDNGRGVDSERSFGTAQLDQMQRITGRFDSTTRGLFSSGAFNFNKGSGKEALLQGGSNQTDLFFDSADSPDARVSSTTDGETRPRNVALMYIIKT